MRKILLLIIVVFVGISAYSQKMTTSNSIFGIGIGPSYNYIGITGFGSPAVRFTFEKGLWEIGPGTLALGAQAGTYFQVYKSSWYDASYFTLSPAARASYWYNFGQLNLPKLNAYAGSSLGLRFVMGGYTTKNTWVSPTDHSGVYPHFGAFLGANWFLNEKTAAFVETGYDVSWGTIGFNFLF